MNLEIVKYFFVIERKKELEIKKQEKRRERLGESA